MRNSATFVIIFAIALSLYPLSQATAERATSVEMELVCRNWLAYMVYERGAWAGDLNPTISGVQEIKGEGIVLAHCFAISPRGYVVVPVLKELPPVKAYSDVSSLDPGQTDGLPQLLREVLFSRIQLFIESYGSLDARQPAQGEVIFGRIHRTEWERFAVSPALFRTSLLRNTLDPLTEVGPLMTTLWHQQDPYRDFCPMGYLWRCVVGCVATAVAQIMKYHDWPVTGIGSHSYYWPGDYSCPPDSTPGATLTADFSDPYDWVNMPDSCEFIVGCTATQDSALAELCYEVGVSFNMLYGCLGSAASPHRIFDSLPVFFRYSCAIRDEYRSDYSPQGWFDLIKAEIDLGRPMLYCITNHAIVCDGWRDSGGLNQYHINYGWRFGENTGWFTIDQIPGSENPIEDDYLYLNIKPIDGLNGALSGIMGPGEYLVSCPITVAAGDTLQLMPGTTFKFDGNLEFSIHGTLLAQGTADSLIIFTADTLSNPDRWGGLEFYSSSTTSRLDYCIVENVQSSYAGIYCDNSSPTLNSCTIRCSRSEFSGGVFCASASPTFTNCTIHYNRGDFSGGVHCENSSPVFTDCAIWNNVGEITGGGIYCLNSAVGFTNCRISRNLALNANGGGVFCNSSPAQFVSCHIDSNAAGDLGGGVYCFECSPTFTGCTINNNSSTNDGGGMFCWSASPLCADCSFNHNWSIDGMGGGVYCHGSSPQFTGNSIINSNNAYYSGGGVFCNNSSPAFTNSTIAGNQAALGSGGGVYCNSQSDPTFHNCTIGNNEATEKGAGVYCTLNSDPSFDNCTLNHNLTMGEGGGVYAASSCSPQFANNCVISSNTATLGGGLYGAGSAQEFDLCTINDNSADIGGGLYFEGNCTTICTNSAIIANNADEDGGGVYCQGESELTFTDTRIVRNSSLDDGGGIFCAGSSPVFFSCNIDSNSATGAGARGGGLYCQVGSAPACSSSTFHDNWAAEHGGAICCLTSSPSLVNCLITENLALADGGGLYCSGENATPVVEYCTFSHNIASGRGGGVYTYESSPAFNSSIIAYSNGSGIYFQNSTLATIEFCDLYGNTGADFAFHSGSPTHGPSAIGVLSGTNALEDSCDTYCNIFQLPRFTNAAAYDYYLLSWSHCVGAADTISVPPPYDIQNNIRPDPSASNPDIGAYENYWGIPSVQGPLWGTLSSRTYPVVNTIWVEASASLTMPPGCAFRFDGGYPFEIYGTLDAAGTLYDPVVFTADPVANPNLWRGLRFYPGSGNSLLSHCLIENGLATGTGSDEYGGGVYCEGTSVTFNSCDIVNNAADAYGGGLYCTADDMSEFNECNIIANTAADRGGGVYCQESGPGFFDCHIDSNWTTATGGSGGGVYCREASPTLNNTTISENRAPGSGGGISCVHYSYAFVDNCELLGDSSSIGGAVYGDFSSYPTFNECVIDSNEAGFSGGAIWASGDFMLCSIRSNQAPSGGGVNSMSGLFEDCIIRENEAVNGGGVFCSEGSYPQFWRCHVDSNTASTNGGGIYCINLSWPEFTNCSVLDNSALSGSGGGLYCWTLTDSIPNPVFSFCTFSGNSVNWSPMGSQGGGVYCNDSPLVFNSSIISFSQGDGVFFQSSPGALLTYCDLFGNSAGDINFFMGNPAEGPWPPAVGPPLNWTNANFDPCDWYQNIFQDPYFLDRTNGDYHLTASSRCIGAAQATGLGGDIEFNPRPDPTGSMPDIGAYEHERGAPLDLLSGALSDTLFAYIYHVVGPISVLATDTLVIMPGATLIFDGYFPFDIFGTLLAEGIEYGTVTFTTDTLANPGRWQGLRFHNPTSDDSQLDYCLIEYGKASGTYPANRGGGVWCSNSAPGFNNCVIRFNSAVDALAMGGGVYCENGATPAFLACRIDSNSSMVGGGGCSVISAQPSFHNCTFSGNSANSLAGGLFCSASAPPLVGCIIDNNTAVSGGGGGIYCESGSSPPVTDCVISNNTSGTDGGGVYCYDLAAAFERCLIAGNTAGGNGGGAWCGLNASPSFTNCTIAYNSGGGSGGGIYCMVMALPTLNSSVIAYSTGAGIYFELYCQGSTVQYCDFFANSGGDIANPANGPAGIGQITTVNYNSDPCDQYYNIFLDPLFTDAPAWDFQPLAGSPCIDGGDPTLPPDPDGTITDIGQLYYHQNPTGVPATITALEITIAGEDVVLTWPQVTLDTIGLPITVDYYRVYRDTVALFVPSAVNLIDSTTATTFVDTGILGARAVSCFYNVTSVSLRREGISSHPIGSYSKATH